MAKTGEIIKKELERKGMSQKDLCKLTGIKESAMSKYLAKEDDLRSDILAKIAKALDVNIYMLMGIQEKEGTTFDVCKTALLARSGTKLSTEEKQELINLIFGHD
jgi:transcriptional regulator with XRE-family HTH domain